jgi:hypothetical protein
MVIPDPLKHARMETPEYENLGASGFEKSILPVYSISGLLAGMILACKLKVSKEDTIISGIRTA